MGGEPRAAADPDLHPYPSPPLSAPSKGPPAALLAAARPVALTAALSMGVPPPPAVLDTLRLPLLNKVTMEGRGIVAGSGSQRDP